LKKAFSCSSYGKVLGVFFDLASLTWKLPDEKIVKALNAIEDVLSCDSVDLLKMQKLLGRLNNIAQMAPFLRAFKFPLNQVLKKCNSNLSITLSYEAKKDLFLWANFLLDPEVWKPIAHVHYAPPLGHVIFVSDASGKVNDDSGCGCVGLTMDDEIFFAFQMFWSKKLFLQSCDEKGAQMCNKTVTLEMLGLLVPFVLIPELLCNRYIVLKVDNIFLKYFFGVFIEILLQY
jgi:hypothetical protein